MKHRILTCLRQINMNFSNFVFKSAILIAQALPFSFGYFLADCSGDLYFFLSSRRRKNVTGNLKQVLGVNEDNRILKEKTREVFRNAARNYFDLTRVSTMRKDSLDKKTTIYGWQHLVQARSRGKGVILATAHLGNFELGAQAVVNRGIEMTILVEEFSANPILEIIAKLRQRKGVRILPITMRGMKDVYYDLIHGGTVTIVCDRDILHNGINLKFLGEDTTLPYGAVSLAQRTGAALIPIFSIRNPHDLTSIYIESPLELVDHDNRKESLRINMEKLAVIMEKYIRRYPEQWAIIEPFRQGDKARS
jgi:lauroyl/myristoyl acyltransferase